MASTLSPNEGETEAYVSTMDWKDYAASRPKKHVQEHVNKPFHNLTLSDIEGAHPKLKQPFRKPRGTDPLEPAYVISAYNEPEPEPSRFTKNALDNSDVDGAKPRQTVVRRITDPLKIDDIPGSTAAWRPRRWNHFGKPGHIRDFNLQVHDINARVQRKVRASTAEIYAPVKGSQPRKLVRERRNLQEQDFNIRTDDVPGAQSPTKTRPETASLRPTNHLGDVRGAGAASGSFNGKVAGRKVEVAARALRVQSRDTSRGELLSADVRARIEGQLSEKTAKEVMTTFKRNDRSGSGKLTAEELGQALGQMQIPLAPADVRKLAGAFDTQLSGFVDYVDLAKSFAPQLFKSNKTVSGPAAGKSTRPQSARPVAQTSRSSPDRASPETANSSGAAAASSASTGPLARHSEVVERKEALFGETLQLEKAGGECATRPASSSGNGNQPNAPRGLDRMASEGRETRETAWADRLTPGTVDYREVLSPESGTVLRDDGREDGQSMIDGSRAFSDADNGIARGGSASTPLERNQPARTAESESKSAPISLFQDFRDVGGSMNPENKMNWDLQPETGRIPGTERLPGSYAGSSRNGMQARPQSAGGWAHKSRGSTKLRWGLYSQQLGFQGLELIQTAPMGESRSVVVTSMRAQAAAIAARSGGGTMGGTGSRSSSIVRPQSASPASYGRASVSEQVPSGSFSQESVREAVRNNSVDSTDSEAAKRNRGLGDLPGHVSSAWVKDAMRQAMGRPSEQEGTRGEVQSRPKSAHPAMRGSLIASGSMRKEGSGLERLASKIDSQREAQWLKQEIAAVRALA